MATNPRRESDPNIDTKRLVQQAQGGDNEAFGALYEGLAPPIYRYVLRHVGGNRDVAEDLTSDVFLKVYEKLDTYKERGLPFTAWLYRVTRNHVVDHVRGRPKVGISPLDSVPEVPVSNGITFEQHAELRAELSFALVGLTAEQRTAVELRFLGGLTTAETAKIMGKSEDSVKKLQARGLSNLRAVITSVRDWTEGEEAGKKVKTKEVKHNPSPSSATLESGSNAKEPTGETLERSEDDGADLTCYRLELYTSHLEIDMNRGVGPERPIDSLFNRLIVEAGKRNKPSLDNAGVAFDPENASGIVESASQASRFAEKVLGVQRVKERLINDLTALGFTPDDLDRTLVDVAKSFLEPKVVQPSIVDPEGATAIATPTEQPLEPATPPIQVPEISVLPPVIGPEVVPAQPVVTLGTIEEPQVSVPPAAVVETPTPEKRYIQEDVGPRAAQVLLELYKINETRDNFLHPDLASAVATVYEEALAKLPDNKRIAKVRDLAAELTFNGFRGFATKYRHAQEHTLKIPKNLTSIMTAIAGEPEYGALEVDEVLQIPDRKITFQEVQQKSGIVGPTTFKAQEQIVTPTVTETPVTPISPETGADRGSTSEGPMGETGINVAVAVATAEVEVGPEAPARNPNEISDIEAYILAKGLLEGRGSEVFRQLRLQIGGIDERSIIPIVDAVNESLLPDDLDDRVVWESLYGKLRTFISDPETVLEANRGSDSHALLRLIRPLNSEEDLITFLGSIPVKKKFPAAELTTITTEEISICGNNGQVADVSVEESITEDPAEAIIPTPDQFYISPIRFGHPEDRPTDEDKFRSWIEDQVYPRRGDPDVVLNNRSEAAWRLLMDFEDRIIHEDDDLLILNKPAGVNSHYNQFSPAGVLEIARNKRGPEIYLGHRLDRPTTGVMVLAKGLDVTNVVREQFAAKSYSGMEKVYLAILNGEPEQNSRFPVQVDIARTNTDRMSVIHPGKTHPDADESTKRWSLTYFSPKIIFENGDGNPLTFTEIQIVTGRTHQIRVVSADFLGQPIVGDRFYGDDKHPNIQRPLLHAFSLKFKHPTEGQYTHFTAPIPEDFQQFIEPLSWKYFHKD